VSGVWYAGSNVDYGPSFFQHTLLSGFGSRAQLEEPALFRGLRVRMGVVTGEVPSGTAIKNSALFQLAKGQWRLYTTVVPVAQGMTSE